MRERDVDEVNPTTGGGDEARSSNSDDRIQVYHRVHGKLYEIIIEKYSLSSSPIRFRAGIDHE